MQIVSQYRAFSDTKPFNIGGQPPSSPLAYSLVPNRRGVGISGGGFENSPKHNKRVGWNSRGVGNDTTVKWVQKDGALINAC